MPPSHPYHDPVATVMVTFWIMLCAACLMLFVCMALEILLVTLKTEPPPISFTRAIDRLRKGWRKKSR